MLGHLGKNGIDIDQVTQQLEQEGDEKFAEPFDKPMETLKKATAAYSAGH